MLGGVLGYVSWHVVLAIVMLGPVRGFVVTLSVMLGPVGGFVVSGTVMQISMISVMLLDVMKIVMEYPVSLMMV